jgi:hypothetical protein
LKKEKTTTADSNQLGKEIRREIRERIKTKQRVR